MSVRGKHRAEMKHREENTAGVKPTYTNKEGSPAAS